MKIVRSIGLKRRERCSLFRGHHIKTTLRGLQIAAKPMPQALESVRARGGVAVFLSGFDSLGMSDNISAIWLKIMEVGLVYALLVY